MTFAQFTLYVVKVSTLKKDNVHTSIAITTYQLVDQTLYNQRVI